MAESLIICLFYIAGMATGWAALARIQKWRGRWRMK